ncbi:MAG: bifunctional ADP-dependent NAD(P)H-hydrate dehydratase/NAD(P)H-hydrate epimerase [Solirubrobacterales bacterium]|nr:MAG: bifunctional ADP-dependent NAD(P)H-hydrate dehydratase/NAD(P)H-hydrate epimerase [Solirubrobacterales bacterium]
MPGWLMALYDAERMRATDRWAIEERGIRSLELMERAGAGVAALVAEVAPAGRIVIACGKGNNGGDGLVAARLLRERGREVDVLLAGDPDELRGDARANLERLPQAAPERFERERLSGAAVAVDALLGTGFTGAPRGAVATAIAAINAAGLPVVAVDVPSGVDASTGEVAGDAVAAVATTTFHAAKPGLWIHPGKSHTGRLAVVDIGIPEGAPIAAPTAGLIGAGVLELIPRREPGSTKFASGALLVGGGSRGLSGAPSLVCEAAARAGAGYVTACVPRSLEIVFELRLLEAMSVALPDADGALGMEAVDPILQRSGRADALALGPGLGREQHTQAFARAVALQAQLPLVLDADGLNAHAGRVAELAGRRAPTVLTPHAGELGRLLGIDSGKVEQHRHQHATAAARDAEAIVVLKGDDTLVATPDGRVGVSRGGSPALATAGTGDVLTGVIGALLAKRMDPFAAACAGVYAHAQAGRLAAQAQGSVDGVIASDVIAALPRALAC